MITSAAFAASSTVITFRPSDSAFAQLALPFLSPTTTLSPDSCRFLA